MYQSPSRFPEQMLTEAEKIKRFGSIEKWAANVINSLIGIGSQILYLNQDDTYRKQINYNLVSGYINEDDFKYVTKPYGISKYNFPATFTNYNIITPKISLLEGEEAKRPFNFRVVSSGDNTTNQILREKTRMYQQMFKSMWEEELMKMGVPVDNPEEVAAATPEEIENYFSHNYKTQLETTTQNALDFLVRYCDIVDKFNTGWRDLMISGEEIYWTGIISGEPVLEVVNPVYFHYDKNPDLKYIEDAAWAYRESYVPPSVIYDKYGEYLSPDQIEKIEQIKGGFGDITVRNTPIGVPIRYTATDDNVGWRAYEDSSNVFVTVIHCEWKSLKKIGFLRYLDENGEPQEKIVGENYVPDPTSGEFVDWKWINTVWEATRIGTDIFVNVREKPNQYRNLDNPNKCKLGYCGVIHNARNSRAYSLVEVMKPHQYLYNIIMYRLELEIARAKGKKMIFDVAQIPRSEGFDLDRWLYYFDTLGIAFINSFEEGKGKFAGQRPTFNQFSEIDLSLARVIDQYVMLLTKIEEMVSDISGVSRQRQGQVMTSETVGGVERAVQQSSYITESLFFTHNMCKQNVLTSLLECAKIAWAEGKKVNYVMDDMTRILINIDGTEFVNEEIGIFVSNNAKDDQILEAIKQLSQQAMQAGQATLKDIIAILEAQNVSKAKNILETSYDKAQQAAQQQQQMELQAQQQQMEQQAQIEQAKMQLEDSLNQRDNDTKIQVALIQAESAAEARMPEDKTAEIALKAQELEDKKKLKETELRMKENELRKKHELEREAMNRQHELEKEQLKHDKKMTKEELSQKERAEQMSVQNDDKQAKADRAQEKELANKELSQEQKQFEEELKLKREIEQKKLQMQKEQMKKDMEQREIENQREHETRIKEAKIAGKKPNNPKK